MKTLIFERAGMPLDDMNDVGTCRIRTAFHTADGSGYYLELIAIGKSNHTASWCEWDRTGFVDSIHQMTGDKIILEYPKNKPAIRFTWTLAEILKLVNSLGGDYDAVKIAEPTEYRVFQGGDGRRCNFGDEEKE